MEGYVFKYPRAQGHRVNDQSEPDALLKRRAGSDVGLVRLRVEGNAWWDRQGEAPAEARQSPQSERDQAY